MHQHCVESPSAGAAALPDTGRSLLLDLNRFAQPREARAVWQVASTVLLLVALVALAWIAPTAAPACSRR